MKDFIKIAVITLAIAGIIIALVSCEKEMVTPQNENPEVNYLRVESVSKSGQKDYSTIERVEIK